jgi:hypothetical protein
MRLSAVLLLALVAVPFTAQADTLARFSGDNNGRTPVFEPGGPWMLYWYTQSDNTLPKTFEMRLYDADSGKYLGTVIQSLPTARSCSRMRAVTGWTSSPGTSTGHWWFPRLSKTRPLS